MSQPEPVRDQAPPSGAGRLSLDAWGRRIILAAMALALALASLYIIWLIARPLALLIGAIVIAQALAPVVDWLARWLPRGLAIALVYVTIVLGMVGIGWLVIPDLVRQTVTFLQQAPVWLDQAQLWMATYLPFLDRQVGDIEERLDQLMEDRIDQLVDLVIGFPMAVFSVVAEIILVLILSIYWLIEGPSFLQFVLRLLPAARRDEAQDLFEEMGNAMGGYVRGAAIDAVIVGTMVYIGLLIIGVEYPLMLALVAGLGEIVPIAGPILATVPALIVALLDSPTTALIVLVFYLVLQQIESNFLVPNIMH